MSIESESAPDMTRSEEFNLIQVRVRLYSPSSIQRQIEVGPHKNSILRPDSNSSPTLTRLDFDSTRPDTRLQLEYNYITQSFKRIVFCFIIEY